MHRKPLVIISFIALIVITGYYFSRKISAPSKNLQQIRTEVNALEHSGYIENFDIIFQTSQSAQSKAIQLATHSTYSHCGIVHNEGGHYSVWEACNGVSITPLESFIARGKGGHFVIKRLKNQTSIFNSSDIADKMAQSFRQYLNRPYDLYFGWGDDKLYCSELVWKVYKQATGIELGQLHQLRDFDLSNPLVREKMQQRYGSHIPLNEQVISPADIFNSGELETVKEM